jgi:hypothetical protein
MLRQSPLAAALCLVCIVLQVRVASTSETYSEMYSETYYTLKTCPFPSKSAGDLEPSELPKIVGVPPTDPNLKPFLDQTICKGMCYRPITPLSQAGDISDMQNLNGMFQCQNTDVRIEGETTEDICASLNGHVQKPECVVIHDTIICIVDALKKRIYVNIFLQPCAVEYNIYVVNATETFGDLRCNLRENKNAIVVNNVLNLCSFLTSQMNTKNNLVFASAVQARKIVAYKELLHAMSTAQNFDEYKAMLQTWQELCGKKSDLNATAVCRSVTDSMLNVCQRMHTEEADDEFTQIKNCVNKKYADPTKKKILAHAKLLWCGLTESGMDQDKEKCVHFKGGTHTKGYSFNIPLVRYFMHPIDLFPESFQQWISFPKSLIEYYLYALFAACLVESYTWLSCVSKLASQAFSCVGALWASLSKHYEDASERKETGSNDTFTFGKVCCGVIWPLYRLCKFFYDCFNKLTYVSHKIKDKKARQRFVPVPRNPSTYTLETNPHKPGEREKEHLQNTLFIQETKKAMHEIQGKFCGIQEMISFQERADRSRTTSMERKLMERKLTMGWAKPRMFSEAQDGAAAGNLRLRHDRDFG